MAPDADEDLQRMDWIKHSRMYLDLSK